MARISKDHSKTHEDEGRAYLSPREQQIMEIIHQREQATASEVMSALPGEPSNSAVRTHLRILETKGHLRHVEQQGRFVYSAVRGRQSAARSALSQVVTTFFDNSVEKVVATLLSAKQDGISDEELDRLQAMIDAAKQKGR
ncbi:MAG: BlaI/MecI/CopY family transcriptional regulator [Cytophagales bacterium]|nr:BlaI/MecI/CopY family transcriptional regulator [Armatimonadota bacterium]